MIEIKEKNKVHWEKKDGLRPRGKVVAHSFVLEIVKDKIEEFHSKCGEVRFATTWDGLDSCAAIEVPHQKARVPHGTRAWFGFVNVNSNRQRTRLYGGLSGDGWSVVFNEYPFRRMNEREMTIIVEDAVARWSFNLDRYIPRLAFLKETTLRQQDSALILIEAARAGVLAWRGLSKMEETRRGHESRFEFLSRFCMAAWLRPPISSMPPTNQLAQLYGMYRRVADVP